MVDTTLYTSTDTKSLETHIAAHIRLGVHSLSSHHDATTEDILRIYHNQISNMFITEQIRSALMLDPFQHLKENIPQKSMDGIINSVSVISHHSVKTLEGYVRTEAIVALIPQDDDVDSNTTESTPNTKNKNANLQNKKRPRTHRSDDDGGNMKLRFTYTRSSMASIHPCTVSYTIDLCSTVTPGGTHDFAPKPLLWIQIYAAGVVPSSHDASQAININNADDDQWSDIDDDQESVNSASKETVHSKARDVSSSVAETHSSSAIDAASDMSKSNVDNEIEPSENGSNDSSDKVDRYEAGMDPDVVSLLVSYLAALPTTPSSSEKCDNFAGYGDITIFFLLMTFPFYEHEWDIVGFLLHAVFDNEGSDED